MSERPAPSLPHEADPVRPWSFVPILYFMQALPYMVITEVAPVIFKTLGIPNATITQWVGLLGIPYTIKFLWAPLVDLNSSKRKWLLGMQALLAIGFIVTALAMGLRNPFAITIAILGVMAFFGATCDIAVDGYYLLALSREKQAAFVGIQSTFFRLGKLFSIGLLVWVAGLLQEVMPVGVSWVITLGFLAGLYGLGRLVLSKTLPIPSQDVVRPSDALETRTNLGRTALAMLAALSSYFAISATWKLGANAIAGSVTQLPVLGDPKGWRLPEEGTFFHQKLAGLTLTGVQAEELQLVVSLIIAAISIVGTRRKLANTEMGDAFSSFLRQPGIVPILLFMVFYRFGEAMVGRMAPLFFLDPVEKGGMGMTSAQVGLVNGTLGAIGMVIGGILGGTVVSKLGFRKAIWPLVIAMHTPNLLYIWAAATQPGIGWVSLVAFIENLGYGIGFAAYLVYLMWVAQRGKYKTAHYAIGTGLGAMFISLAGIVSGVLQSNFGYVTLFVIVSLLTIPGILILFFIPMESDGTTNPSA